MGGDGRGIHSFPCRIIAGQITDMGVAGTWLTSQVAYHSGAVGRGRTAPHRTLLWSAVNVVATHADFSHCCVAWDAVNSISHITWKTAYKGVDLYAGLEFWTYFDCQEGGSTYVRIDLYARTYGNCSIGRSALKSRDNVTEFDGAWRMVTLIQHCWSKRLHII